jgi:serine protease
MIRSAVRVSLVVSALFVGVTSLAAAQEARYIVKFRAGRAAAGHAAVRAMGGQVLLTLDAQDAIAVRIPAAALNGLSRNPNVEYIEEDVVREPYAWSNTTVNGETVPYGIQMIQADKIGIDPAFAAAKKICIIDSGYSDGHDDLKEGDVTAKLFDSGAGTWNRDSCGHGTHVAGTISAIAGNSAGVVGANPGVSLHIVKVFGDDNLSGGSCGWTYSSTLVNALNQCTAAGANVVSMSLGGTFQSRTEENAFANANKNGVLSIAAAGNAGNTRTSYPAGYASVMSVAAVDANEVVASFSQRNKDVEIAAPGVSVLSTVPWIDTNTLSANGITWTGGRMEGAARTNATSGTLVNGGRCTAAGAWAGAIVLCERGDIAFADKVVNVQAGGGVAAVIYNNIANDATCGLFSGTLGDAPTTNIPAIALSCADGANAVAQPAGSAGTVASTVTFGSTGGYESWDGTSMATPHVSAVAALVWACNPAKTNQQVRDALDLSARDKGTVGRDNSYGYGIVQAAAALDRLGWGACTPR